MNEVTLYVSPRSGHTYEIVPTNQGGWLRWEVLRDGQRVQFALEEAGVPASVRHYEEPGWDGIWSSRYD